MQITPATNNNSTIILSLLGLSVAVAIGAIHIAGWKHKLLVWGLLAIAAALAVVGVFWVPISAALPALAAIVGNVASAQFIWFLALLTALFSTITANLKVKRFRNSNSTDLAVIDREWRQAKEVERRLQKLEERGAGASDEALEARAEGLTITIREAVDAAQKNLESRIAPLEQMNKVIVDDYQRMRALGNQLEDFSKDTSKQLNTLFLALQAIRAIEVEGKLANVISYEGAFLTSRVKEHQSVKGEHWIEWLSRRVTFDSAMDHWIELARGWHLNIDTFLREAQPQDLTGDQWKGIDELFEGSGPVITYASFAFKFEQWKAFRPRILTVLEVAAFGGPNAGEITSKGGLAGIIGQGGRK